MLEPMNDYITVKLLENEKKTESGILLPESSDPMYAKGVIVGKGPGKLTDGGERFPPFSKSGMKHKDGFEIDWIGETVLFAKYAAVKIEHEGEEFYFVKEVDILARTK